MRKNGEATERRVSIVKYWEVLFEGGLQKSRGTLHVRRSYENCLYQKISPSGEVRLAGIWLQLAAKVSVAIATIADFLEPSLQFVLMYA